MLRTKFKIYNVHRNNIDYINSFGFADNFKDYDELMCTVYAFVAERQGQHFARKREQYIEYSLWDVRVSSLFPVYNSRLYHSRYWDCNVV